ncbi:response regulator [Polaromonas naphthalenivorans]|uniref:Response regulator receiver protein n=1 Tax=Polaromonas naphthalenivorans (strain CJ2) TaxID=365044 RepID=A1VVF7_POLNA|nr:response regulator [Polaromonas naphthalenivorans]ABM39635.1 response regulator receiver protein [Polaromonas naphthalenivorans CJ2]
MSFPLYRRLGGIIFLDDDQAYLQVLGDALPEGLQVRLFHRPAVCAKTLIQEQNVWNADFRCQQEIVKRWHGGTQLIPQILKYWRDDGTKRFSLTKICMVDYSMPAMNGVEFLHSIKGWKGSRILLTGLADEQIAVSAFNSGLIQKYIPKQTSKLTSHLINTIGEFLQASIDNHQQIWSPTLSERQLALISDPLISKRLEYLSLTQGWVEHVVIGAPFGVLSQNSKGTIQWLQLEAAENLQELAELAEHQGWDDKTVRNIKSGETLIDVELRQVLDDGRRPEPRESFPIDGEHSTVYAAQFGVYESLGAGCVHSYGRLLVGLSQRAIQD